MQPSSANVAWSKSCDAGSEFGGGAKSLAGKSARTARKSAWNDQEVFSDDVYDCILEHLPTRLESYRPMEKNRKRHFIPLIDRLGGVQTKVPFWSELSKVTLGSDDVRDAYVRKFRTTIESRFKTKVETVLKTIQLNHRLDLTRDSPGYSIPPHTDTNDKAVKILYYLAQKGGKSKVSMGTKTYFSKKNESDAWKDGIASAANNFNGFTEIESAPFVPNVVFAFAPCWSSWHGVKNIGNSDCLLYTSPSPRDKRQSRMPSSA